MFETLKTRARNAWRGWIRPTLLLLLVLTTARSVVADWNDVPTGSMLPTILEGDRIFVNKMAYDLKVPFTTWRLVEWSAPQRGEIVVFYSPVDGRRMVKRVVGVPGDRLELRENRLYVNGAEADYQPLTADEAHYPTYQPDREVLASESTGGSAYAILLSPLGGATRSFEPVQVPAGRYFVMGDNRDRSFDSRAWGFVDRHLITGEAIGIALSVDPRRSYAPRWERFFRGLQ